jgi:hypothetical protein
MARPRKTGTRRTGYRRTRFGAAAVAGVFAATWAGMTWMTSTQGGAATAPGRGSASAQTLQVLPKAGSLSIGVTLGESLAGHQNNQAKAQSQAIDLGAIGTSLTGYSCGKNPTFKPSQLPQALIVESGDKGADVGITQTEEGGAFSKFGKANVSPYSEAITTSAPVAIAGVISIGAGVAKTWSGVVNGQRVAGASSDIAGITLPGGVSLAALHWEAVYSSTGDAKPAGVFSIGQASAPGAPAANPLAGLDAINAVLSPIGLHLVLPTTHVTSGTLYVDPLKIEIVPNATRDGLLNTVLKGIQPIREPTVAAVLKAYCQGSTELTVADVAIGSISGAGSFELVLGGAQATSGTIDRNGFDLGIPGYNPPADLNVTSPAADQLPAVAVATPETTLAPTAPPVTDPAPVVTTAPAPKVLALGPVKAAHGKRGGTLAAVGLGGLGLLAVLAEGDRRKMRHAQRLATLED